MAKSAGLSSASGVLPVLAHAAVAVAGVSSHLSAFLHRRCLGKK